MECVYCIFTACILGIEQQHHQNLNLISVVINSSSHNETKIVSQQLFYPDKNTLLRKNKNSLMGQVYN